MSLFPPSPYSPFLWQPSVCSLHLWVCFCFIIFYFLLWRIKIFLNRSISSFIHFLPTYPYNKPIFPNFDQFSSHCSYNDQVHIYIHLTCVFPSHPFSPFALCSVSILLVRHEALSQNGQPPNMFKPGSFLFLYCFFLGSLSPPAFSRTACSLRLCIVFLLGHF